VSTKDRITGVLSPVVTPFKADLSPDPERFVRQCRWLLSQDVGLAVFGTNSLSTEEKVELLDRLVGAGVDAGRMMPGTGCCALTDSVRLTAHAMKLGCGGVLMLPPFYYKGVSDDGLFKNFAEVIERVGDRRLRIYLYHIPPVSQVPITVPLIARLLKAYPGIVAGAKDSSGDWNNTKAYLDNFAKQGFDVFPGSETFLLQGMRGGGVGCISATANVNPGAIARLFASWRAEDADLGDDGAHQAVRRHVEGGIAGATASRSDSKSILLYPKDFRRISLLDGNLLADRQAQVNRGGGKNGIEWDLVVVGGEGKHVGANLVGDVAIRCDPVRAHKDRGHLASPKKVASRAVADDLMRNPELIQFPGGQPGALEPRPGFVDQDMHAFALLMRRADHPQRGPKIDRG